ncbi:hypothetical protein PMAYCL1PPCAC_32539, partial [Pristionchus mayeri]
FKVAKAIGVAGYLIFFVTTIPMCIMTVCKLYNDRKQIVNSQVGWTVSAAKARAERVHVFASVVLTVAHALKATQQTIWFVALLTKDEKVQATMISLYAVSNALTSFAEPILLLISSRALRKE